jgi:excisionase family DNA binding protein
MTEEWISPADVAQMLDVSPRTVARWIKAGEMPAYVEVKRVRRFRRSEIERWLAAREEKTRVTNV